MLFKIYHTPKHLKLYSEFETIQEMNESVQLHMNEIDKLPNTEKYKKGVRDLLRLLQSMSKKHIGVSYMTENTMAKRLGVSKKTIERRVGVLVKLDIIKKVNARRRTDNRQSSNILAIKKKSRTENSFNYSLKKNNKKTKKTYKLSNLLPKKIRDNVTSFFKKNEEIKGVKNILDYWTKKQRYKLNESDLYMVFTKAIQAVKTSRNVYNALGLLNYEIQKILTTQFTPEPLPVHGQWLLGEPEKIDINRLLLEKPKSAFNAEEKRALSEWENKLFGSNEDFEMPF